MGGSVQDCGPEDKRFPGIFGSCAVDQSCPICLGYGFALNDKVWIMRINDLLDTIYGGPYRPVSDAGPDRLKELVVEEVRERFKLINARRQDKGMSVQDVERIVKDYMKIMED